MYAFVIRKMKACVIGLPAEIHSLIFVTVSSPTYKIIKMHFSDGIQMTAITADLSAALLKTVYVSVCRTGWETKEPAYFKRTRMWIFLFKRLLYF